VPGSRIACLLVPGLPLAAELRAHPELRDQPVAIASAEGPRAEILAVSPEAERAGVRLLTSVVHARSVCAELRVRVAKPALERAARDALRDAALSTSPRVEAAPAAAGLYAAEAAVFADARGVASLFHSESGFAGALAGRARRLGLPAVVSVAASRSTARTAARLLVARASTEENETLVIPPGEDDAFLAPLPLDFLNPDDALADALARFGLRRIGDLTRLPERALVTRFGAPIRAFLARARGQDEAPPPPAPADESFAEAMELEVPVASWEPLRFVLHGLLTRLGERLECRGLALGDLQLRLGLEEGGHDARRIGLSAPTLDARIALRLIELSLAAKPPPAPVTQVQLGTSARRVRGDQLDFFRPAGPAPATLSRTLAELQALCGNERVGAPAVADDHRPDAFAMAPFQPPRGEPPKADAPRRVLAVRALRPPVPASVRVAGSTPCWIQSALANGPVQRSAGPWRTTGRWWSAEERYAFDHYDVQTDDGWVVRLRYDLVKRRWEIDGVYD
jgi:protein ImuB